MFLLQKRLEKSREQRKYRQFKLSALSVLRAARAQGRKLPDARRGGTGWVESLPVISSTLCHVLGTPRSG
jgi:hypothetical protein